MGYAGIAIRAPLKPISTKRPPPIAAVDFFEKSKMDPSHWETISAGGLKRIREKLLMLAAVYGFWKHVSKLNRLEIRRYLEMFYALKYRKLAEAVALAEE
nr:sucrose synthase [Ipomoea batatas]